MNNNEYHTNQKRQLVDFLANNKDKDFTVEEIVGELSKNENAPGKSTIYRLIGKMLENGEVRRFESHDKNNFVYQYNELNPECDHHFHLKCIKCGRMIHMECVQLEAVRQHILEEHRFIIGGQQIISGICEKCAKNEETIC